MKSSVRLSLISTYHIRKILTSHQDKLNNFMDDKIIDSISTINVEKILLKTSKDDYVYIDKINRLEVLLRMYQVLLSQEKSVEIKKIEGQILEIFF